MMRKLLRQAPKRNILRITPINRERLNHIIPRAYDNLELACSRFVEGIQEKDYEFLQSVMSPYLYSFFKNDFEKMKDNNIDIEVKDIEYSEQDNKTTLSIHPYVLFGGVMKRRLQNEDRFFQISHNRYMRKKKESQDLISYLREIKQNHIYGFQCLLTVKKEYYIQGIEDDKKAESQRQNEGHEFLINIETDSQNQDYYIVDLQGEIRNQNNQ